MKYIMLFTFLLCTTTIISAQHNLNFGLKIGANLSKIAHIDEPAVFGDVMAFDDLVAFKSGIQAGAQIGYQMNRVELGAELLYEQKGYNSNPGITSFYGEEEAKVLFAYLSLPLLVRYYVVEDLVYLGAGGSLSYLIQAQATYGNTEVNLLDIGLLNRFDAGLLAEVAVKPHERVSIQFRYMHGLSALYDDIQYTDQNGEPLGEVKMKNRSFQLSLTYDLVRAMAN